MKILQISSAATFGGGEKHLVELTKGAIKYGEEVYLIVRPDCQWSKRIDFVPVERVFKIPLRNSLDIFSALKIARIIRQNNIEILHAHLARDYAVASLAIRFAPQAKLILTRHVLFPFKKLQKFVLGNVSKVIAVSDAVQNELKKIFPEKKIVKIYNGIDIKDFAQNKREDLKRSFRFEHNIPFDAPFIGTIGELKELKGQQDFILAANEIIKEFPDARFAIVGKDNSLKKSFRFELKRLVKIFDLEDKFLWLDWVEDTSELLAALDIFVSASHSESFGLAILEAMANKTPIVATQTEGAKELIENDFSGKLAAIKNPIAISKAVCGLLRDRDGQMRLTENAQKTANEKFSLDRMIKKTLDVYQGVLD